MCFPSRLTLKPFLMRIFAKFLYFNEFLWPIKLKVIRLSYFLNKILYIAEYMVECGMLEKYIFFDVQWWRETSVYGSVITNLGWMY